MYLSIPQKGDFAGNLNGVIPETFADQIIKYRIPYCMPGELVVAAEETAQQFNEATFLHTLDKPFEVHLMHVELTGLDEDGAMPDVQPETLDKRVRLRIDGGPSNEHMTKNPALVATLVDAEQHLWKWDVPLTITRQEGFTISCDVQALPTICVPAADCATNEALDIASVRVEVNFEGYLIVIRPASDSR